MDIAQRYSDLTSWMAGKSGELRSAKQRHQKVSDDLKDYSEAVILHSDECEILRITGELLRERIKGRVENLVTSGIRSVFGREDYRFELDMQPKRGQMTATPMLINEFRGTEIRQPVMEAHGGGLVNVVAFVLQAVVLALTRPKLRRIMVLDEVFKNVRDEMDNVGMLLRKFHDITGISFIVVTKAHELCDAADIVYDASKDSTGATKFDRRI